MDNLFDRNTARGWFADLQKLAAAFQTSPLDDRLAIDAAVAAWSLVDWVHRDYGKSLGYPKFSAFRDWVLDQCPSLRCMQDIANMRKHGSIERYLPTLRAAERHQGAFGSGFSSAFDTSRLVLERQDGSVISFAEALRDVVTYWNIFFETANP